MFVAYSNGANDNFKGVATIGIANGQARWQAIRTILFAWIVTLPAAGGLSAASYLLLRSAV